MYQRCIDEQTPPTLTRGDVVDQGEFLRNLKKDHIAKRYAKDTDDKPEYGYKLKSRQWKHWGEHVCGLSVNLRSCIHSEVCSIAIDPNGPGYFHVARIDLGTINHSGLMTSPLVAQYDPVPPNECHFLILPRDGTVSVWMELATVLDDLSLDVVNLPTNEEEQAQAKTAYDRYRALIDIRAWVRARDRTLS
jgi:hypothetical protein